MSKHQFDKVMGCVLKLINDLSSSHCGSTILYVKESVIPQIAEASRGG